MSKVTAKSKRTPAKSLAALKNGSSSNGTASKSVRKKKPLNQIWIEKYGVDDSALARSTRELFQSIYDAHHTAKS